MLFFFPDLLRFIFLIKHVERISSPKMLNKVGVLCLPLSKHFKAYRFFLKKLLVEPFCKQAQPLVQVKKIHGPRGII